MTKEEHIQLLNSKRTELKVIEKDFIDRYSPYKVGDKFEPNKSIIRTSMDVYGDFYYEICLDDTLGFYHQDNYETISLQELLDDETFKQQ